MSSTTEQIPPAQRWGTYRNGRRMRAAAILALLVAILLSNRAAPASAHAGGLTSTDNEPALVAITPPVPGITVRVVEFGARLRLDNASPSPVVVEPLPGAQLSGLPTVPPQQYAYWSDPRIIAAGAVDRPASGRLAWTIPLRVGDTSVQVRGEQYWPPTPATGRWWLLVVGIALVVGLVGVFGGTRMWSRATVAAVAAVVLIAHLVHVAGSALVPEDSAYPVVFLVAAGYALLGWPLGTLGIVLTVRGRPAGLLLIVVAGALFGLIVAPGDAFTFFDPVVPFAWGAGTDRLLISLTVGGGLGTAAAATAILRRPHPQPQHDTPGVPS